MISDGQRQYLVMLQQMLPHEPFIAAGWVR
jgi:hypothetical protein